MKLFPLIIACALVRSALALYGGGNSASLFSTAAKPTGTLSNKLDRSDSEESSSGLTNASLLHNLHKIDHVVEKSLSDRSKKLRRRRPADYLDEDSSSVLDLDEGLSLKTMPKQIVRMLNFSMGLFLFKIWLWLTRSLFGDPHDAVAIQVRTRVRFLRSEWNPNPLPAKTPRRGRALTSSLPHFSASKAPGQPNMQEMLGFDNTVSPSQAQDLEESEEPEEDKKSLYDFSESRASSPLGLLIDQDR